ncbi:MAG: ABC transporter ATP-binding protein [Candidatus Pacebacteria bacterium]|nr:ABC transporter ATP-binding protein [Candidatus Paceibacterota bacterium]
MSLIETHNIVKEYYSDGVSTRAIDDVSLSIEKGEFVAIVGPSGSGKSTLMHVLGCLDRSTGGTYLLEGHDISLFDDNQLAWLRNKHIGFVFQSFNLLPRETVLENVMLPLVYANIHESKRVHRAKELIELVGLQDRTYYKAAQLSGGQKQRVAIARALVSNPHVIFADEPTGNLDSKSGEIILRFLQDLNEKEGHTIVIVTHESYVAQSAKRIVHIHDGHIEKDEKVHNRKIVSHDGFTK